jgi:hypothetical protein
VLTQPNTSRIGAAVIAGLLIVLIAFAGTAAAAAHGHFSKRTRVAVAGGGSTQKKAVSSHRVSHQVSVAIKRPSRHTPAKQTTDPKQPTNGSDGHKMESTPTETTPVTTPTDPITMPTAPAPAPTETTPVPEPPTTPIETTPVPTETTPPPTETTPASACPIGATTTSGPIPMTMPGCRTVASDTSAESNETSFWGALQCASSSRYSWGTSGGDTHLTASDTEQGNSAYRQMTAIDGDEFWGERCELGEDDWRTGPTAYYREGDHYVTYISERLPSNFPLNTKTWQTVMQMKQAEPSNVGGGAPIIEMEARENKWVISDNWVELFSFPAKANQWTRFAWNVYYSKEASKGTLQVSADLNGDGDFEDPGERSPTFHVATLKTEIYEPGGTGEGLIPPGAGVPSHLRAGIYHNPEIPCPTSTGGCSVQVDNVQVMAP